MAQQKGDPHYSRRLKKLSGWMWQPWSDGSKGLGCLTNTR
jgi:hypothetical protein